MTNYEQARIICTTLLSSATERINADFIKETIGKVNLMFNLEKEDLLVLQEELEALYAVFSDKYRILDDNKPDPWVKSAKAEIRWNFWNRYRMLLEQKNYAPDTINQLDNLTDDVLDRLIRPGKNMRFDKRGLIVGHVQSGKTGNYIGLICKAADAGYRLIIVLAGIHNSLRSQTQLRVDEGFLGFDTQMARNFTQTTNRIGVGKINPNLAAHSLTTNEINGDFNRRSSESSGINIHGNDPIILVIKKNASVMKNLLGWLASRGETMEDGKKQIKNLPLLLIDDEADNASINISKNYVSGINGCIRSLLKLFEQSSYIGYTATPYANIFIRQYTEDDVKGLDYNVNNMPLSLGNDIFPKNFIVNIPAPSNYIGPERLFGIESLENIEKEVHPLRLFRTVKDHEPFIPEGHKKELKLNSIPPSLHKAIKCFFLSCAARRVRGQENQHNTMLIHVTRFIDVQDEVATQVENEVKIYARRIEFNDRDFLRELQQLWHDEYEPTTIDVIANPSVNDPAIQIAAWSQIEENLYPAVARIEVRAVHGDTKIDRLKHKNIRPLDYYDNREKGLSVIAVGGNKLSRGITLEGLTISYFLRASKMYDTLMQMGRWFGYRPGYLDLCRLFTSDELIRWYEHITVATEEMRSEFDRMGDLDKTPSDYGLKVRTHPDSLVITAANKFRYKHIMKLSFSSVLEETYSFKKNDPKHLDNYNITLKLINDLGLPDDLPNSDPNLRNHYVWRGINNAEKVINYLSNYHTVQPTFNTVLINKFIENQQKEKLLTNWTIALINNTHTESRVKINKDVVVGLTKRSDASPQTNYYSINKSHIIDPRHEYIDLTDDQITRALNESIFIAKKFDKDISKIKYPTPVQIKMNRPEENGLLIIYLLNPKADTDLTSLSAVPIVGLAISFPWMKNAAPVEYAVNEQFLKELNYPDELDEEDIDEPLTSHKAEKNLEYKDALLRKMETCIRLNVNLHLEFKPGNNITYVKQLNPDDEKLVAIASDVPESLPLVRSEDIDRYYINPYPDFRVVNGGHSFIDKGAIITTNAFQGSQFSMSDQQVILDNNCLAILIKDVSPEYLLAIFNSALFTFYNADLKGDKMEKTITNFPIATETQNNQGIISLVKSILFLQKDLSSRDTRILISFFVNVLDAAVFEIYFPEIFRDHNLMVLAELDKLPMFENDIKQIEKCYELLNKSKSAVKKAVYEINTIPEFKLVYQNLTHEN